MKGDAKMSVKVWYNPCDGKYYVGDARDLKQAQATWDVTAIKAQVILDEVLGLARPAYVLRNICRVIRMPSLTMSIDIATALTGVEKVPALVEADISAQNYTRIDFELWKNVVHVVISDEARMKAAHDIMRLHVQDAAAEIARMEDKQIAEAAGVATEIAGSDWGNANNNPFDDLVGAISAIEGNGYPVDFIAAHPLVWGDFFSNPYVRGVARGVELPKPPSFPVPGLPGVTGYASHQLASTIAIVGSTKAPALVLGEGPTEAAQYRNEPAGYDAYIIRQYLQPKLLIPQAIRKLTGVHA